MRVAWQLPSRTAGPGRRLAVALDPGGALVDPRSIAARARALGVQGVTVLGLNDPADLGSVATLVATSPGPVLWRGALPADAVPRMDERLLPLEPDEAPMVEVRPGGQTTWVHGAEGAGSVGTLTGDSLLDRTHVPAHDMARLRFLDGLLGGRAWQPADAPPPPGAAISVSLLEAGGQRIARACLRLMLDGGGRRSRTVLRDGAWVRGRLWDPALRGAFNLGFSVTATRLWTDGPAQLRALHRGAERERRRRIRRWLPTATEPGDWLLLSLVPARARGWALDPEASGLLRARLCLASPLAALLALERVHPATIEGLVGPAAVRILECQQERLAQAWPTVLRRLPQVGDGRASGPDYQAVAHAWGVFIEVLDARRRLDLVTALLQVAAQLPQLVPPAAVLAHLPPGPAGVAARAAAAQVFAVGDRLRTLRRTMGQVRYGDARHAEAQLYMADYDAHFAAAAGAVQRAWRRVAGVIG